MTVTFYHEDRKVTIKDVWDIAFIGTGIVLRLPDNVELNVSNRMNMEVSA